MTKAHFIALADTIRACEVSTNSSAAHLTPENKAAARLQWELTRDALADMCAKANPAFNRALWLDYVNGKTGPSGGKR